MAEAKHGRCFDEVVVHVESGHTYATCGRRQLGGLNGNQIGVVFKRDDVFVVATIITHVFI